MLEKYYKLVKYYEEQIDRSTNPKVRSMFFNNIKNKNPNINDIGLLNIFKINCSALEIQLKELKETKIFHIGDELGIALEMTNNSIYNRHLPFNNMFFEYNLKVKKLKIFAFNIFKDQWGTNIRCFYEDDKLGIKRLHIPFFDKWDECHPEGAKILQEENTIASKTESINFETLKNSTKKDITNFFLNFIDFLNTPEVELVTVERTKEQNEKRIIRGKRAIPIQVFVKVTGKLKIYLNELYSKGKVSYSHKFWVRGHFRTLRNEERYGDNTGTKIWILPYLKGEGILINKQYNVTNTQMKH